MTDDDRVSVFRASDDFDGAINDFVYVSVTSRSKRGTRRRQSACAKLTKDEARELIVSLEKALAR